jgi:group II intron reverse transcriptase/maturase
MNADGKSDEFVGPSTPANNDAAEASAESVEERDSAERNAEQPASDRTPGRKKPRSRGLHGVREAARRDSTLKFTALLHHVSEEALLESFYALKRNVAVGVDEMTWHEYEHNVEDRIADLHDRIHRGAYRAKPSRRVWIPKPDGRQRPLGIAALEDKLVQQAVLWVLQSIYEQDFLGFSYGFRRGRSQHDALDALNVALTERRVNWVLDADIEGFFDAIDHSRLIKFLEHRIGDRRILRLIRKWLRAGIMEDGEWTETDVGSPQGSVISPLLANVFLHYVFDLWVRWWRQNRCRGEVVVVRYADDFVMGFEHKSEAEACLAALHERFGKFGLKLHRKKTRLIEFGRRAITRSRARGGRRPETFNFLGFTHVCSRARNGGHFVVWRLSMRQRIAATLTRLKAELRLRMHDPLGETGRWLRRAVQGWLNYHAVPGNSVRIRSFIHAVGRLWWCVLRRRSQRASRTWTWARMRRVLDKYLPRPRIQHPYPAKRFRARLKAGAV